MTIIMSIFNRFKKFVSLEDSLVNLQLPCETLMSAKQAINDKL